MLKRRLRLLSVLAAFSISVAVSACGGGNSLEGTYLPASGAPMTLDFVDGKVKVNMLGEVQTLDYTVEGDTVTILNPEDGNMVLTRNSDGSLTSPIGTFSKSTK